MPERIIAGIDEVGRGPLAGPVVAACVHIPDPTMPWLAEVTDSKKLTKLKRLRLDIMIRETCDFAIAELPPHEIDAINIYQATMQVMREAAYAMPVTPDFIYIDGNKVPAELPCPAEAVVKGDEKIKEIACASIIAKVYRDTIMEDLAIEFPEYGWDRNSGYGSPHHLQAINEYGPTPFHRMSFAPMRLMDEDYV